LSLSNKYYFFIVSLFILSHLSLNAQNNFIDSLQINYNKEKNKLQKVKIGLDIALYYTESKNFHQAIEWLKKIIYPVEKNEDSTSEYTYNIIAHLFLNNNLLNIDQQEEAKKYFFTIQNINNSTWYRNIIASITSIADSCYDNSEYFKAYQYYNIAGMINIFLNDPLTEAKILINKSKSIIEIGLYKNEEIKNNLDKAEKILLKLDKKNISLEKGIDAHISIAELNLIYALYYERIGRLLDVLYHLDLALVYQDFFNMSFDLGMNRYDILSRIYLCFSRIYTYLNQFKDAYTSLEKGFNFATLSNNKSVLFEAFFTYAEYCLNQNNLLEAQKYYQLVTNKSTNKSLSYLCKQRLANVLYLQGKDQEAFKLIKTMINDANANFSDIADSYLLYYTLLLKKTKKEDTSTYKIFIDGMNHTYDIINIGSSKTSEANYYLLRAELEEFYNKKDPAQNFYKKAIDVYQSLGSKINLAFSYYKYANFISNYSTIEAFEFYVKSFDALKDFLKNEFIYLGEFDKQFILEKIKQITNSYKHFIKTHVRNIDNNNVSEMIKLAYENEPIYKNLLLNSAKSFYQEVFSSPDTNVKKLLIDIKGLKKQVLQAELNNKLQLKDSLNTIIQLKEKKLAQILPTLNKFKDNLYVSFETIHQHLQENEAIVEYAVIDSSFYVAFIITKTNHSPLYIEIGKEEEIRKILQKPYKSDILNIEQIYQKNSELLYKKVWYPVENILQQANIKTVHIIPAGILYEVAFAGIKNTQNQLLCDNYQLHFHSNSSAILNNTYEIKQINQALLIGNVSYNMKSNESFWTSLPGTKNEIENISKILTKNKIHCTNLSEQNATENNFISELTEKHQIFSLIHIATHGFYVPEKESKKEEVEITNDLLTFRASRNLNNLIFNNTKNPMLRSGLVFAGANDIILKDSININADGLLTAAEITDIPLNNVNLVVLSACESALGDVNENEGVMGLQRAFKQANVKNLIVSLWQIPDNETAEFMQQFYQNLFTTKNIHKAFTQTQWYMKHKYQNVYYWGAFMLIN